MLFLLFFRSLFDDGSDGANRIRCLGQQISIGRRCLCLCGILARLLLEMIEQRLSLGITRRGRIGRTGRRIGGCGARVRSCEPAVGAWCPSEAAASAAIFSDGVAGVPAACGTFEPVTAVGEAAEAVGPSSAGVLAESSAACPPASAASANDVSVVDVAPFPPP